MSCKRIFSRFHSNHGERIKLENDGLVAEGNGVVFSERPIHPGELFAIGFGTVNWDGSLEIGLTNVNPSTFSSNHVKEPKCGLPDLKRLGRTWLYTPKTMVYAREYHISPCKEVKWPKDGNCISEIVFSDDSIHTCWGSYPRLELQHLDGWTDSFFCRTGVLYIPTDDTVASLYGVIGGHLAGPYVTDVPYREHPLYGVVNIYDKRKRVRLFQIQARGSLKQMCRRVIWNTHDMEKVHQLKLPKQIRDYLNYGPNTS